MLAVALKNRQTPAVTRSVLQADRQSAQNRSIWPMLGNKTAASMKLIGICKWLSGEERLRLMEALWNKEELAARSMTNV